MRLWRGWGIWEGFGGWVWCFLPLSDDGGVFTASFYRNVCMSRLSLVTRRGHTQVWKLLTPATRPNAGIFWQVLVHFCTLLLHCPVHQVLKEEKSLSTESSLEHIPLNREDRQVRPRALFFASGCPCQLFMKGAFSLRRAESPWNGTTGFNFSVRTHWERPEPFSVFTREKH